MFIRFDTAHERDRQTDTHRHTPHDGIGRAAKTIKPVLPNAVENDASARSSNLTSPSCDFEL